MTGGSTAGAREPGGLLDHTLLRPDAKVAEIDRLCDEAREHGFAAVCVNGVHVERCATHLAGEIAVAAVVGFPLGAAAPAVKAFEARRAIEDGARELDVVVQIGALKDGDDRLVLDDLAGVCAAARTGGFLVKAILEAPLLDRDEKERACRLAREAGAGFVKTSTGFGGRVATVDDVALLRRCVGDALGVKAAGGIRTAADARRMIAAGATRIGTSAAVAIAREWSAR